jgi:hypothetical protein
VPLGYVTTLPAARNASTCAEASGVRIISRKSWPMVSTEAPKGYSSMNGTRFREIRNPLIFGALTFGHHLPLIADAPEFKRVGAAPRTTRGEKYPNKPVFPSADGIRAPPTIRLTSCKPMT